MQFFDGVTKINVNLVDSEINFNNGGNTTSLGGDLNVSAGNEK